MPHSSKSAVKGSAIKKGIKSRITTAALGRVALTLALSINALGQTSSNTPTSPGASTEELQKATQNPVASLISVPFQNNVDENIGPYARERNTFNIQPVFPTQLSKSWNLISRIITPLIYQPFVSPGSPDLYAQKHLGAFGLGDIQPTFFFASSKPSKVIWGAGPALLLPTATDDSLGSGKLCIGPSVVALVPLHNWGARQQPVVVRRLVGPGGRKHDELAIFCKLQPVERVVPYQRSNPER
jgi:hypothetical protein